jgi:hypothetical protein
LETSSPKQKEQTQKQLRADKLLPHKYGSLKFDVSFFLMSFLFLSFLNSLQSSLTIYILPSSFACCVNSRHHPHPLAPTPRVITEPGRVKKELSEIFLINWQCSNIMQYLNNEYGKIFRGCVFGPHSKKACAQL